MFVQIVLESEKSIIVRNGGQSPIPYSRSTRGTTPKPLIHLSSVTKFHLYFQLISKIIYTLIVLYVLVISIISISRDVNKEMEEIYQKDAKEREKCKYEFEANKCNEVTDKSPPFQRSYCRSMQYCLQEPKLFVSKTKQTVKFIAQLINEFVNPISPKALVTIALISAIVLWIPQA